MPHEQIPDMLGRVLSGTKYAMKQTRGKFGLGAKMALIWAKMSTGLPIEVLSAQAASATVSYYLLDIDIPKNCPHVIAAERRPNADGWRGSELSLTVEGNWSTYRAKMLSYLRQLAIITPYAEFSFRFVAEGGDSAARNLSVKFARRTDIMPRSPTEAKYHPSALDLMTLKARRPIPLLPLVGCSSRPAITSSRPSIRLPFFSAWCGKPSQRRPCGAS